MSLDVEKKLNHFMEQNYLIDGNKAIERVNREIYNARPYKIEDNDISITSYNPHYLVKVEKVGSNANGEDEKQVSYMEKYKHPAELFAATIDAINLNAKAKIMSAKILSESILNASTRLANSIDNLTNEVERKNKLDEYYMLIKEIDQFENTLMQLGKFEEAYEEMNLVMIPTIELDEYQIYILNLIVPDKDYDRIIRLAKIHLDNPLVIALKILEQENTLILKNDNDHIYIRSKKDISDRCADIRSNLHTTVPVYRLFIPTYTTFHNGYDEDKEKREKEELVELRKLLEKSTKDNETILMNEYDRIKENEKLRNNIALSEYYIKITGDIEIINREIFLKNLRTLHCELRNAVRRYKIQSYNEG